MFRVVVNTFCGELAEPAVSVMLAIKLDSAADWKNMKGKDEFYPIRGFLYANSDEVAHLYGQVSLLQEFSA